MSMASFMIITRQGFDKVILRAHANIHGEMEIVRTKKRIIVQSQTIASVLVWLRIRHDVIF